MRRINYNILYKVKDRIERRQNWLCSICGDTGSGKSYIGMSIGEALSELLNSDFTIDNVAFEYSDVIDLAETLPKGSVVVMDEAGRSFGARDFMKAENKQLSVIFQTFRFKQICLIWTLPDLKMIDINARRLMHSYIETIRVDFKREVGIAKYFDIVIDRWNGEVKHVYPRIKGGVITSIEFPKPSQKLVALYETKKQDAFSQIVKSAREDVSHPKKKSTTVSEPEEDILEGYTH